MEGPKREEMINLIGSLPIMNDGCPIDDNLGIAVCTYFEEHVECPDDDKDDESGWSQWAIDKTENVLERILDLVESRYIRADLVKELEEVSRIISEYINPNQVVFVKYGARMAIYERLQQALKALEG